MNKQYTYFLKKIRWYSRGRKGKIKVDNYDWNQTRTYKKK